MSYENRSQLRMKKTGPWDYIEVPGITHFEMYIGEAFARSSNAAADWFVKYLK